jgi:hypothetical protein
MGSDHDKLLLNTKVRWSLHGKVLCRVFDLKDEITIFLLAYNPSLSQHFMDKKWLALLSFLTDIFEKLNGFN